MKNLFILFLVFAYTLPLSVSAQLVVSDVGATALLAKSNALQTTIQLISNNSLDKLGNLGELSKKMLDVSKEYQNELKAVSSFVSKTSSVAEIFKIQKDIVNLYATHVTRYDKNLDNRERNLLRKGLKGGVTKSLNHLADLDVVISPNFLKMSDAERLSIIEKIKSKMEYEYKGMSAVTIYFNKIYNLKEVNKKTFKYLD